MKLFSLFALLLLAGSCQKSAERPSEGKETILAIGSCNKQYESQAYWKAILENKPELWVWLGDAVYPEKRASLEEIKESYLQQKSDSSYQGFTQKVPVTGIWDDHDYGLNNGGKENPFKEELDDVFFDFLGLPVPDHSGIYRTEDYSFQEGKLNVKFLLLDTRSFRDELLTAPGTYYPILPNPNGSILGEAQWTWLENELSSSEADLNIICSGIQVLPNEHPFEKWANFPQERERLLSLMANSGARGIMLLSGDRHIAEFSKIKLEGMDYPVYEFTSSGLTHFGSSIDKPHPYRIKRVDSLNFGLLRISKTDSLRVSMEIKDMENRMLAEHEAVF